MFHWERWYQNDRVCVSVSCYPHHWSLHWRENGARKAEHTLDTTLAIGPWSFSLLIFRLGRLSWLTRWIPTPKRGYSRNAPGFLIGWD